MSTDGKKYSWLPGLATALSLFAYYSTLAVLALLGALGVAIALDEALWAGAIVATAVLAVGGLAAGATCHQQWWPFIIGGLYIAKYRCLLGLEAPPYLLTKGTQSS